MDLSRAISKMEKEEKNKQEVSRELFILQSMLY
jgi:hypothetical protein